MPNMTHHTPTSRTHRIALTAAGLIVTCLAAASSVAAHGSHGSEGIRNFEIGPYLGAADIQPFPLYEQKEANLVLLVGTTKSIENPPGRIEIRGPAGFAQEVTLVPGSRGYDVPPITLGGPGNYSFRIIVTNSSVEHAATIYYEVLALATPTKAKDAAGLPVVLAAVGAIIAAYIRRRHA